MKEHRSWHVAAEDSVLRQQTFSVTTEFSCRSHPHYSWNKYGEERTVRILSSLFESIVSSICYSPRTCFAVLSQRDATHNYYHSASMKTNSISSISLSLIDSNSLQGQNKQDSEAQSKLTGERLTRSVHEHLP